MSFERGLIGYTGFVGSNLVRQHSFEKTYNTTNIDEIDGQNFDFLVCAGVRAEKWKANQNPEEDWQGIEGLINHLKTVKVKKFVLISTVDVYPNPLGVVETTKINPEANSAYGKNRYHLEKFAKETFSNLSVIRLPGLFGDGIKKNLIFDIINNNNLNNFDERSEFQFYNLDNIWNDVNIVIEKKLKLVNLATEPVSVKEVFATIGKNFENQLDKEPVKYDMRTLNAESFGESGNYLYSKEKVLSQIQTFLKKEMAL